MSRSYRKYPRVSVYYGKSGKFGRRQANKKIRNLPLDFDLPFEIFKNSFKSKDQFKLVFLTSNPGIPPYII